MSKDADVPKFAPHKDQVDYTNARWAPVVNSVIVFDNKVLLLKRNEKLRFYPGYWNGVSGFLDDKLSLEDKVKNEISEELGVEEGSIDSIQLCDIFDQEDPEYDKTWIVHAVLVKITTDAISLDWESEQYKWVEQSDIQNYDLVTGFDRVVDVALAQLASGE